MKGIKKLLTGILAATMIISSSITAFASEGSQPLGGAVQSATISITHTVVAGAEDRVVTYDYYQVLKAENITDLGGTATAQTGKAEYYTESDAMAKFLTGTGLFDVATKTTEGRYYVAAKQGVTGEQITAAFVGKDDENNVNVLLPSDTPKDSFASTKLDGISDKDRIVTATSGSIEPGYYLVISDLGTVAALQTLGSVSIQEKNTFPGLTKTKPNDIDIYAMFDFNKKIPYDLEIDIPASVANKDIIVVDTATKGLTLDKNITVTNATDLSSLTWGDGTLTNGKYVYTTTIPANVVLKNAGKKIKLSYTATINENAVVYEPESNTAHLEYDNYKSAETEPIEVYTIALGIFKYTLVNNQQKALTGAEFSLWDAKTNGNQIKVVAHEDGVAGHYRVAKSTETGVAIVVDNDGKAQVDGLELGTYYLQEDKAPTGFNKLTERQIAVIDDETAIKYVDVLNNSGSVLPSTGGIGTTIFYILGGILIIAGVAYFMVRRKVNAE